MKGPFKTGVALNMLFRRVSADLTKEELEYLAGASEFAEEQADSMASMFNTLAVLVNHQNAGKAVGIDQNVQEIFWHTSEIFEQISGLIHLASDAEYLLNNPNPFKPQESAEPLTGGRE